MTALRAVTAFIGAATLLLAACDSGPPPDPKRCPDAVANAWIRIDSGTTSDLFAIGGSRDGELLAVGDYGVILYSTDDGLAWNQDTSFGTARRFNAVWDGGAGSGAWLMGTDNHYQQLLLHGERGHWTPAPLPSDLGANPSLQVVAGDGEGNVYVGSATRGVYRLVSGMTWSPPAYAPLCPGGIMTALSMNSAGDLFIAREGEAGVGAGSLCESRDLGTTWDPLDPNGTGYRGYHSYLHVYSDKDFFTGTFLGGLRISHDGAATWRTVDPFQGTYFEPHGVRAMDSHHVIEFGDMPAAEVIAEVDDLDAGHGCLMTSVAGASLPRLAAIWSTPTAVIVVGDQGAMFRRAISP